MSGKILLGIAVAVFGVAVADHDRVWGSVLTTQTSATTPLLLTPWDGPLLVVLGVFLVIWAKWMD